MGHFCPSGSGSGSSDPIESGSDWFRIQFGSGSATLMKNDTMSNKQYRYGILRLNVVSYTPQSAVTYWPMHFVFVVFSPSSPSHPTSVWLLPVISLLLPIPVIGEHGRRNYKNTKPKMSSSLLVFTDCIYSQSWWHFRPLLLTVAPLPYLWPPPPLPSSQSKRTVCGCGGGGWVKL